MPPDLTLLLEQFKTLGNPDLWLAVANNAARGLASPGGLEFTMIKIVFIMVSAALFGVVIYFFWRTNYLKLLIFQDIAEFLRFKPYGVKSMNKSWQKILAHLDMPDEAEHKLVVVEADDMVDETLKRMGYKGNNLGERLGGLTSATISNIESLQRAHALRNNIVHDPNYHLTLDEARRLIETYEKALQDLQVLE